MARKRPKKSEIGPGETPAKKPRRRTKKAAAPDSKAAAGQPELFAAVKPEAGGKRRRKPSPPKKTSAAAPPPAQAEPAESTVLEGASMGDSSQRAAPGLSVDATQATEAAPKGEAAKTTVEQPKRVQRPPLDPENFAPVEGPPPQSVRLCESGVAYVGMKKFGRPLPNKGMSGLMGE